MFAIVCSGLRLLMREVEGVVAVCFNKEVDFGRGGPMVWWIPVHGIKHHLFRL